MTMIRKREAFQMSSPSLQYGRIARLTVWGSRACQSSSFKYVFTPDVMTKLVGILTDNPLMVTKDLRCPLRSKPCFRSSSWALKPEPDLILQTLPQTTSYVFSGRIALVKQVPSVSKPGTSHFPTGVLAADQYAGPKGDNTFGDRLRGALALRGAEDARFLEEAE